MNFVTVLYTVHTVCLFYRALVDGSFVAYKGPVGAEIFSKSCRVSDRINRREGGRWGEVR